MPEPDAAMRRVLEVKDRIAAQLMARPNVTGVGVGYRNVGERRTDEVCIRVYVNKKLPLAELPASEVLPASVEGVRVDVIEAFFETHFNGSPPPIADHRKQHDPLVGGISIGKESNGTGTLGAWALDNHTGDMHLLSNWHVLCGSDDCVGDAVIQPGPIDGGGASDVIGHVRRAALTNQVDAAVARLSGSRPLLQTNLGLGSVADIAEPVLGLRVRKSGRTTGVTTGIIADASATVRVCGYPSGEVDPLCSKFVRTFVNQIVIEDGNQLSKSGDSGSVWIDDANWLVGLHFAGGGGSRALANPMLSVLDALQISIGLSIIDLIVASNIR